MSRKETRFKDRDWPLATDKNGAPATWDMVEIAVLMDIRDELHRLNGLLHCTNFQHIPMVLRRISANTANLPKASKKRRKEPA